MQNPQLVIMAAGMGSRYGGLKQIDTVDDRGHTIIDYSLYDAIRAGFRDVTFIIKKEIEDDFREVMDNHLLGKGIEVNYAYQELDMLPDGYSLPIGRAKPWGTAHAIACLTGIAAPFAVINADDYYGAHAFERIFGFLEGATDGEKNRYAMVAYRLENTVTEFGSVSRGICRTDSHGMLEDITERSEIYTKNGKIYYTDSGSVNYLAPDTPVSMNLWGFTPSFISECRERFSAFLDENLVKNPIKSEFYIPSVVSDLIREGRAEVQLIESEDKWQGITYKEDKSSVVNALKLLREQGIYPHNF